MTFNPTWKDDEICHGEGEPPDDVESCRCNCGYTCGGPGVCGVFKDDPLKCIKQHYRRDCDHVFDGPMVQISNGWSVTCSKCGITACAHDTICGP